MGRSGGSSSTSLAPGFRFHPTDEELLSYYLRRKVCGKPLRFDAIAEIEVYKSEPWDLPGLSKLKTRDLEWYFFSALDKKYGNGSRTNRATGEGYWKTTGKDRPVQHKSRLVGMKKTLVYHRGRAPRGERTNWVMHEYRLVDEELEKAGMPQEAFVLCRIFQKSGSGPKNGERYGAPFIEEEWEEEDEVAVLPGDTIADEMFVIDELFIEGNDLEQSHGVEFTLEGSTPPLNLYQGESSNFLQNSSAYFENDQKPLAGVHEGLCGLASNDDKMFSNPFAEPETETTNNDYNAQPSVTVSHAPTNCLPEEQCFDSNIGDGFFLEANDLSEPIEASCSDFELPADEYLTYFDAEDDIAQYLNFDTSELLDANAALADQAFCNNENLDQGTHQASTSSQQLPETDGGDSTFTLKQVKKAPKSELHSNYPFMEQASHMLGSFPAPPAFASEFPTKDMAARLHAAVQSSESLHLTAGMIRIRNMTTNDSGMHWSFDKCGIVNVVLSFSLPEDIVSPAGLETFTGMISGKLASVLSRSWFYFFFLWVTVLAISAKVGTCIYGKR